MAETMEKMLTQLNVAAIYEKSANSVSTLVEVIDHRLLSCWIDKKTKNGLKNNDYTKDCFLSLHFLDDFLKDFNTFQIIKPVKINPTNDAATAT